MTRLASRFEDLLVWQNARTLNRDIYSSTVGWKDYELKDQIRRASVSVSSNIAEGFDRGSKVDFARFLYIARGSVSEVRSQLYLALDLGYLDLTKFKSLYDQTDYLVRQLALFTSKLKSK